MTIELKPEQERVIGQAIEAGLLRDASDVVDLGLQTIRQRLGAHPDSTPSQDADQWSKELHAWVLSHPTSTPLLSDEAISRDSIYGNRGM